MKTIKIKIILSFILFAITFFACKEYCRKKHPKDVLTLTLFFGSNL
jgi:hypothetical protein